MLNHKAGANPIAVQLEATAFYPLRSLHPGEVRSLEVLPLSAHVIASLLTNPCLLGLVSGESVGRFQAGLAYSGPAIASGASGGRP